MEEHLILDFNKSDLKFSLAKVSKYNIKTIFDNIDKFKKFVNDSVISDSFEKVYKSSVFQVALCDTDTCYVANLLMVYNAIASGNLLKGGNVPQITEKELIKQLVARGYKIYRTRISYGNGGYENVKKVVLDNSIKWS